MGSQCSQTLREEGIRAIVLERHFWSSTAHRASQELHWWYYYRTAIKAQILADSDTFESFGSLGLCKRANREDRRDASQCLPGALGLALMVPIALMEITLARCQLEGRATKLVYKVLCMLMLDSQTRSEDLLAQSNEEAAQSPQDRNMCGSAISLHS